MGGDADFILPLRDRVRAGTVFGPEIVASGPMVDNAPPEFSYRLHVTNAEEARVAVRELKPCCQQVRKTLPVQVPNRKSGASVEVQSGSRR